MLRPLRSLHPQQCDSSFEDGTSFLVADLSLSCQASARWLWVVYGTIMVIVYPVGILVWYTALLTKHRKALNPKKHDLDLNKNKFERLHDKFEWTYRVIHRIRPANPEIRHIQVQSGARV